MNNNSENISSCQDLLTVTAKENKGDGVPLSNGDASSGRHHTHSHSSSSSSRRHHGEKKKKSGTRSTVLSKKTMGKLLNIQNSDLNETESTTNSSSQYSGYSSPSRGSRGSLGRSHSSFRRSAGSNASVSSDGGSEIRETPTETSSSTMTLTTSEDRVSAEDDDSTTITTTTGGISSKRHVVDDEKVSSVMSPLVTPTETPTTYSLPGFPRQTASSNGSKKALRLLKIFFIGDSKVGKSTYIHRFHSGIFTSALPETRGVDFKTKIVNPSSGEQFKCQLWDTGGNLNFQVITRSYFPGAHAFAIFFDVMNRATYNSAITEWMSNVQEYGSRKVPVVLVGAKCDITEEDGRQVSQQEAFECSKKLDICYVELSSLSNHHVEELADLLMALAIEGMRDAMQESSYSSTWSLISTTSFCCKIDEENESVFSVSSASGENEQQQRSSSGGGGNGGLDDSVHSNNSAPDTEKEFKDGSYDYGVPIVDDIDDWDPNFALENNGVSTQVPSIAIARKHITVESVQIILSENSSNENGDITRDDDHTKKTSALAADVDVDVECGGTTVQANNNNNNNNNNSTKLKEQQKEAGNSNSAITTNALTTIAANGNCENRRLNTTKFSASETIQTESGGCCVIS